MIVPKLTDTTNKNSGVCEGTIPDELMRANVDLYNINGLHSRRTVENSITYSCKNVVRSLIVTSIVFCTKPNLLKVDLLLNLLRRLEVFKVYFKI